MIATKKKHKNIRLPPVKKAILYFFTDEENSYPFTDFTYESILE